MSVCDLDSCQESEHITRGIDKLFDVNIYIDVIDWKVSILLLSSRYTSKMYSKILSGKI